jgi:hypothetical protein
MPTTNDYFISYTPLALTLSTAIIDIALDVSTDSKSSSRRQGARNFYKTARKYNTPAIALSSTWCSGYLTYKQITENFQSKTKIGPYGLFVNPSVITTGIGLGLTAINVPANLVISSLIDSKSSQNLINTNNIFNLLGSSVLPQLSGGLSVGLVAGSIVAAGGIINNSVSKEDFGEFLLNQLTDLSNGTIDAILKCNDIQIRTYALATKSDDLKTLLIEATP